MNGDGVNLTGEGAVDTSFFFLFSFFFYEALRGNAFVLIIRSLISWKRFALKSADDPDPPLTFWSFYSRDRDMYRLQKLLE